MINFFFKKNLEYFIKKMTRKSLKSSNKQPNQTMEKVLRQTW